MSEPLKLMIYDKTDVRSNVKQLKALVPEDFGERHGIDLDRLDFEIPVGLTHSWFAGGKLYRLLRWVDTSAGFDNWGDALDWALSFDQPIQQIQVWGHGSPGKSWLKDEPLHRNSIRRGPHAERLKAISERMTDDGVIWFRNCSVFCGSRGRNFAKMWANGMNCRIAAHTHVIGAWQSGLHTIGPGEEPSWPENEGIAKGTPDRVEKCKNSLPWLDNTVFMITSGIPKGW